MEAIPNIHYYKTLTSFIKLDKSTSDMKLTIKDVAENHIQNYDKDNSNSIELWELMNKPKIFSPNDIKQVKEIYSLYKNNSPHVKVLLKLAGYSDKDIEQLFIQLKITRSDEKKKLELIHKIVLSILAQNGSSKKELQTIFKNCTSAETTNEPFLKEIPVYLDTLQQKGFGIVEASKLMASFIHARRHADAPPFERILTIYQLLKDLKIGNPVFIQEIISRILYNSSFPNSDSENYAETLEILIHNNPLPPDELPQILGSNIFIESATKFTYECMQGQKTLMLYICFKNNVYSNSRINQYNKIVENLCCAIPLSSAYPYLIQLVETLEKINLSQEELAAFQSDNFKENTPTQVNFLSKVYSKLLALGFSNSEIKKMLFSKKTVSFSGLHNFLESISTIDRTQHDFTKKTLKKIITHNSEDLNYAVKSLHDLIFFFKTHAGTKTQAIDLWKKSILNQGLSNSEKHYVFFKTLSALQKNTNNIKETYLGFLKLISSTIELHTEAMFQFSKNSPAFHKLSFSEKWSFLLQLSSFTGKQTAEVLEHFPDLEKLDLWELKNPAEKMDYIIYLAKHLKNNNPQDIISEKGAEEENYLPKIIKSLDTLTSHFKYFGINNSGEARDFIKKLSSPPTKKFNTLYAALNATTFLKNKKIQNKLAVVEFIEKINQTGGRYAAYVFKNLAMIDTACKNNGLDIFTLSPEQQNIIFGINPLRFNAHAYQEIIKNRIALLANPEYLDSRPLALVIYPEADWNQAFESDENVFSDIISKNYRLLYYEAETENELISAMKNATKKQKAHIVIIGAHGDYSAQGLGAETKIAPDEYQISLSDKNKLLKHNLQECLVKNNGAVILASCSNGQGRNNIDNLANMWHALLKTKVYASTKISPFGSLLWKYSKEENIYLIESVSFNNEIEFCNSHTYVIEKNNCLKPETTE